MEIEKFYQLSRLEIVALFREFIEVDLFGRYPELRGKISLIITGSVPSGHYDEYSDIDTEFFYSSEKDREKMNAIVREYKKSLLDRHLPIQFHPAKTFAELKKEHLTGWGHDDSLREYSIALVVLDPGQRFSKIQSTIKWYPKAVLREKINWLVAEAVFHFEDRFKTAVKRKNTLYAYSVRSHVVKLLGNAILLSEGRWSVFEKRLFTELVSAEERNFCRKVDDVLKQTNLAVMEKSLGRLLIYTQSRLIKAGWISKEPNDYWIALRPKYRVEHCN